MTVPDLLAEMINASAIAAVVSDPRQPDNPIIACNAAFLRLSGYDHDEVVGRNCRLLAGVGTEPHLTAFLREAIAARRPAMVEILNYRKDGTPFRNAVMVAPIVDDQGQVEYFLGSQVEVPDEGPRDSPGETGREAARAIIARLSDRQRQILLEMAAGRLNKQIAFALNLSERTIKMHRAAMFRELGVRTSADAIRMAVEAGF